MIQKSPKTVGWLRSGKPRSKNWRLWQHILGVDAVGSHEEFFDLGGDSFAATTLAAEIEASFGLRFAPSDIIELSTVAKQAEAIAAKAGTRRLPSALIEGSKGGTKPPLFMVHGGSGTAFLQSGFVDVVGRTFQAPGLDRPVKPIKVLEDFARCQIDARGPACRTLQHRGDVFGGIHRP